MPETAEEVRLRVVEQKLAVLEQRFDSHVTLALKSQQASDSRITKLFEERLEPFITAVERLDKQNTRKAGFWAGAFFMAGVVWSVVGTVGYLIWEWVHSGS